MKKELDVVLSLQSDIDAIETALSFTRSTVARRKVPPEAHKAIESLERNHARLLTNVESLYASLNVSDAFPELAGLSLDFVRILFMARDLKINIRKRAIANFLEFDKLDRAVGGKQNPLGELLISITMSIYRQLTYLHRRETPPTDQEGHIKTQTRVNGCHSKIQQVLR